jgi:hypothetical protein
VAAQQHLSDLPTVPLSPLTGEQWTQWAVQDINYHLVSYKAGIAVTQQHESGPSTAVTTDQNTPAPPLHPS